MTASHLANVQQWMLGAITRSPSDTPLSTNVLLPSQRLSAEERLRVYQSAYLARLGECLRGEFPAVVAAVGDDTFNEFAVAYIERYPPGSYTLGELGRRFPEFLEELRPPKTDDAPDFGDFLVDLARYERTIAEAFDAEGPETDCTPPEERMAVRDPAEFAAGRIEFYPCVRLLRCDFPVHEYRSAVRRDESPPLPEPGATHVLIARQEFIVRRWVIPAWQSAVLERLLSGETIAEALATIIDETTPDAIESVFREWTSRQLIRRWIGP